ncbi:hypothetical protein PR202_ga18762 [Eleusine coracana subsp. coracana]|uniref:FBD domain-containing protein n=1 Tax=Eleusine coracana subsp. coracana TaxID=191504 RepID=A0AAV5CTU2_ELECO|nr:hypothetical protein PR202_ga18762 [Eleusine coracana subsp. coracana]
MRCRHRRYFEADGELRSLSPYLHSHLRMVNITGFFGQKDQLELALNILRNAVALKAMKIVPRVEKLEPREWYSGSPLHSADGYRVVEVSE